MESKDSFLLESICHASGIIEHHSEVVKSLKQKHLGTIATIASLVIKTLRSNGKILFMGNGGSAADAQHLAAEFVGRFRNERKALPAIALTTDTSIITAIANDYSFNEIFSRQISAICNSGDVVVGISTSGNSENVFQGLSMAKKKGAHTVAFSGGSGGRVSMEVELSIIVSTDNTARIQEMHILIGHIICEICDGYFSRSPQKS